MGRLPWQRRALPAELSEPVRLHGLLIAPAAQEWLNAPHAPVVHSLYRNSVNLNDGRGELLSLVTQDTGPGPFALVVRPESPGFLEAGGFEGQLSPGSLVEVNRERLSVGPLRVDWRSAAHWKPRPSWEQVGPARLRDSLPELRRLLKRHAPPDSFAALVEPGRVEAGEGLAAAALAAAAGPAQRLLEGLRHRDPQAAAEAAQRLAGLGAGVTPSGDDYLLGVLQALWALAGRDEAQAQSEAIVTRAAPRTNMISRAWLKAAERGEAGHEWHVLAVALASGAPPDEPVEWLIRRGHTSGADALAGFLAAAQALLEA